MPWYFSPHTGGKKIPPGVQERTRARVLAHAQRKYAGQYDRLDVRFRGALCYIDAYRDSSTHPLHLVQLAAPLLDMETSGRSARRQRRRIDVPLSMQQRILLWPGSRVRRRHFRANDPLSRVGNVPRQSDWGSDAPHRKRAGWISPPGLLGTLCRNHHRSREGLVLRRGVVACLLIRRACAVPRASSDRVSRRWCRQARLREKTTPEHAA